MCLYPKLILNRKFTANKKNGGVIPAVSDRRKLAVPKACGKCIECKQQKSREWQVRLQEEIKDNTNGKMVTLTFNTESLKKLKKDSKLEGYELDNYIATEGVKYFCELWRKHHGKYPRHWLITELGHNGTEHIHLHGIIWTEANFDTIRKHWKHGYIYPRTKEEEAKNYVNARTANYCIKYVSKMDLLHKEYNPKILSSKGLGAGYITNKRYKNNIFNGKETKEYYRTDTGHKIALPIYYRNKIYNDEQKEELWIQKLDKNERYVGKEKINIKNGMEEYWGLLEWYREINKRLGFGTDEINWNRKRYEHERRVLIQKTRLEGEKNTSSGGVLTQEFGFNKRSAIQQEEPAESAGNSRIGNSRYIKRLRGAAMGCQAIDNLITRIDYGMLTKELQMWKTKFGILSGESVYL